MPKFKINKFNEVFILRDNVYLFVGVCRGMSLKKWIAQYKKDMLTR